MPVGKPTTKRELVAIGLALGGVVLGVVLFLVSLRLSEGGNVEVRLGSDTFDAGRADRMAERVADGGPLLYNDLVGGERVIWVNHLGDDEESGWVAFLALPPGADRDCLVDWEDGRFVDPCDGTTYPADGEGLEQIPVQLTDGRIIVDLNRVAEREAERRNEQIVRSGTDSSS